jgi:hypothetical protein
MITAKNNRNTAQFGTGLPIFAKRQNLIDNRTSRDYALGILKCPPDRVPTFQFKVPDEFDVCNVLNPDDTISNILTISTDTAVNGLTKFVMSDGEFLYVMSDRGIGISIQGVFLLGFGVAADGAGVYRYYSDSFLALASPCLPSTPNPA